MSELQEQLLRLGFHVGRVDGLFGPSTESALRELQRGVGLVPDGTCGPATLRALAQLLTRSITGGAAHQLRETETVRQAGPSLAGRVIVLDPGHGGPDSGSLASGLSEADVTLDMARRIEGRLAATGVLAVITRSADADPDEGERADIANRLGADLVVSLHCETSESASASGVAAYFYGHDRPGAWSAVGERLADLMRREVVARTGLVDCQSHPRTWDLLRRTSMPAVRLDVGYLTNPGDAGLLADPDLPGHRRGRRRRRHPAPLSRRAGHVDDRGPAPVRRPRPGRPHAPDALPRRGRAPGPRRRSDVSSSS